MLSLKFLIENIKRFNKNTKCLIGGNYFRVWIDELYSLIRFGSSLDDYFRYEFYRKSSFEKNKFITYRRSKSIIKKHNNSIKTKIFNNKVEFNKYFDIYIKRKWLEIDNATQEQINLFCQQNSSLILKPIEGGQGKGISLWHNINEASNYIQKNDYHGYIAEEILIQHPEMKKLNPTSVNTVRVLTFKGTIIAAALRIGGTGAIVDNLHSNGLCGHIETNSGIIDCPCIDMRYQKYIYHPFTNQKLVGFQIPLWDIVKATVLEAANLIPEVGYIGWDVAILEGSVALIEGNHDPGHDVVQMIAQTGLYKLIKNIEKEIE